MKTIHIKRIQDIFSSNPLKKKIINPIKVVVDYREKNSLVASELIDLGLNVEFKELKVADYIVRDVAIERKTVSDFLGSMLNKRLLKQIEDLKQYKNKLILIEGIDEQEVYSNSKEYRGIHPNSVRGFLLSIVLKHKIPLLFTKDSKDTANFIALIAKKQNKEMSLNVSKKSFNKKEQMRFILEGFPGIGPKKSEEILKEFKTLKNFVNAPIESLKKVLGKKAEKIKLIIEGV